jgi:hypothetical protein
MTHIIFKNFKNKDLLARFKKHSYPKKLQNPKTLKIQGTFQN